MSIAIHTCIICVCIYIIYIHTTHVSIHIDNIYYIFVYSQYLTLLKTNSHLVYTFTILYIQKHRSIPTPSPTPQGTTVSPTEAVDQPGQEVPSPTPLPTPSPTQTKDGTSNVPWPRGPSSSGDSRYSDGDSDGSAYSGGSGDGHVSFSVVYVVPQYLLSVTVKN